MALRVAYDIMTDKLRFLNNIKGVSLLRIGQKMIQKIRCDFKFNL